MAKYLVNMTMSTCVEEARNLAFEEADPFMVDDWDFEIDSMEKEDDDEEEGGEDEDW